MNKVLGTARMYIGDSPNLDVDRKYGVTTFGLGEVGDLGVLLNKILNSMW
ncbi:MAG: hypothetical protein ACNI27_08695 [Desulfovibrio sp.]